MMAKRPDGIIRAFGMSGAQIVDDLNRVSREHNLDFHLEHLGSSKRRLENYDQFDGKVRAEASKISEYYEVFFCLENSIRKLISDTLFDAEGGQWWATDRVHTEIRNLVESRKKSERDSAVTSRSDLNIDYTTFGELSDLINKNWDLFDPIFTSQRAVQRIMFQLNALRNPIAHCCPISPDEEDRLELTVKDWFRIIS